MSLYIMHLKYPLNGINALHIAYQFGLKMCVLGANVKVMFKSLKLFKLPNLKRISLLIALITFFISLNRFYENFRRRIIW